METLDQIKTKYYGEVGTPERDRIEGECKALQERINKAEKACPKGKN